MAKIVEEIQTKEAPKKFKYACPACTNTAIETTNKMLGVEVDCQNCGIRIKLDDENAYIKI
jgi:predicted RNA-binding Zn-ribbon protein involved in translation (DUF1610 family)